MEIVVSVVVDSLDVDSELLEVVLGLVLSLLLDDVDSLLLDDDVDSLLLDEDVDSELVKVELVVLLVDLELNDVELVVLLVD